MAILSIDQTLCEQAMLNLGSIIPSTGSVVSTNVIFQFPPKMTSDGKDAEWKEGDQRGSEPVAFYATSGPRKIRLEWTYIVGERSGSKYWSTNDVRAEVTKLRVYFYNLANPSTKAGKEMIVMFKMWNHGDPKTPFSARLLNVDIKHGKTYVTPNDPSLAYPLRTDIGVDLRLWTNSGTSASKSDDKQDLPLSNFSTPAGMNWR